MHPQHEEILGNLVSQLEVGDEKFGVSHVVQVGLEQLLVKDKEGTLTDEQIAYISDVPDPLNYGHISVYLRQINVNRAFKLLKKLDVTHHDYAFGHLVTTGFRWLKSELEAGTLDEKVLAQLKKVKPPKIVMVR